MSGGKKIVASLQQIPESPVAWLSHVKVSLGITP